MKRCPIILIIRKMQIKITRRYHYIPSAVQCSVMSDSLQPHGLQTCQAPLSMEFSRQEILEWIAISSSRGSSWPRN